ncbi:uncharacterized protein [Typha angustifolia]|uniref:uncharacterized protein n=1 Tax=Typha angustifolia TaxID=59011 RepID=UPI003C2BDB96
MGDIPPPSQETLKPHVAALTSSFAAVPSAAVPAIIDCVVASASIPPLQLFSALLHAFPDPTEALQSNCVVSHTAALCHLINNGSSHESLRLVIWRVLVPLLKTMDLGHSELLNQIVGLLCNAVSKNQSWEVVGETIVRFCLRSVGLGVGLVRNDELAVYHWSNEEFFDQNFDEVSLGSLPLSMACRALTYLTDSALRRREKISVDGCSSLDILVQNLTWDLSRLALGMLRQSAEYRSCAVNMILPVVLRSLNEISHVTVFICGSQYTISRFSFLKDIWECCTSLFSFGHVERLDAFNLLSSYFSFHTEKCEILRKGDNYDNFDITKVKEFWEEIRKGLVDKHASVRKQVLYVMKRLLSDYFSYTGSHCNQLGSEDSKFPPDVKNTSATTPGCTASHSAMTRRERWADEEAKSLGVGDVSRIGECCLSSQDRWKVFLLLYEMLEEYGTHLVEAAWTHQIAFLFQFRPQNNCLSPPNYGGYHNQMETPEGILSWMTVLWERGFSHENPQVRCLIMQSFLDIAWEKNENCAQRVPEEFVLGPLIRGLNDVVHHKDFGVRGIYDSKTIQGAMKFFHNFSYHMMFSDRLLLVWSLACAARQESFSRAGLMTLAFCIASSAGQSDMHEGADVPCSTHASLEVKRTKYGKTVLISTTDVLDALGIVIERSKQHFNPNYRHKVCEQVVQAAVSLISATDVPLDLLLHFLSKVPREFTDHSGPLRGIMQRWLRKNRVQCSVDINSHFLNELITFPTSFIKYTYTAKGLLTFDDEDVGAWEAEAQRWARALLLVVSEEQHLEPVFMFLRNNVSCLSEQDCNIDWIPIKFIIIILSLVEEFQMAWRKSIHCIEVRSGEEPHMRKRSDHFSPLLSSLSEKFTRLLFTVMKELVAFAESVCPVFLSTHIPEVTELPCSVKGKLGGPSQRRLPASMSSSILQAILSMRTIACVSSWCTHVTKDDLLDSSFAFLWDFSWKVILSPNGDTEIGAEVRLAAYEALAYVLKALSAAFASSNFDLMMAYSMSKQLDGKVEPSLDLLAINFLDNINDLLTNGILTRSRRAVLMYWKWLCLDSLLSIPYNVREEGIHLQSPLPLFSESTLITIFFDIIESLENAGENSVLSILRCVRLILSMLCSGRLHEVTSSLSGINCQMMMRLVKSSWILHLSCNKRRVAPIAALLSAILHPSVFGDSNMHETHGNEQGPLKWFIEKLLDDGAKSPRTIRLAALHLTGLWLLYPKTVKYYIKELKLLALYGSVAFDEDFEAELSENHEARAEVSLLAQSPDREFTEVFINTELYARVSVAVLFHQLANLVKGEGELKGEDSLAVRHCGKLFLLELLNSAVNDKDLAKELYKKYSSVHRRKVRAWQMICVLSHFVEEDILKEVTCYLHLCLYRNNLPAVRQYLETFAIQIYLKFPTLAEEQLIPIFHNYGMRSQALSSYVFIAANVILHSNEVPVQIRHLNELLPPIVPFLTSHHHSLRGFTQLLVHCVLSKLRPALKLHTSEVAPLERKCFEDLRTYLTENTDCARLRASMEGFLDFFDPNTSSTPVGVFSARVEGSDFECVPVSLMEQVIEFLNDVRDELRCSVARDAMAIKSENLAVPDEDKHDSTDANTVESLQISKDISLDFQKKITLHKERKQPMDNDADSILSSTDFSRLLLEMEKEDQLLNSVLQSRSQAVERIKQSQQQLILVASLLDRIPNLAGLARTCEVFKAAGLAISDASILHDKQFQLISVTAEKWIPIIEVPVNSVKVFLEKKRHEGYSIIGLEQTANSTSLDQYNFPHKTVLVLGKEKEGIPVDIIHVLDACVEIPQLGIIRSLNVHVSGAIALWEYTRQQRCRQP